MTTMMLELKGNTLYEDRITVKKTI